MHVIRVAHTTYALHTNNKTMFMVFKNRNHAHTIESAIRHFVGIHRTLPLTCGSERVKPVPLFIPGDWLHISYELKTEEISGFELHHLCEACNAGYMCIENMKEITPCNNELKIAYIGNTHDAVEKSRDDIIRYLETLV